MGGGDSKVEQPQPPKHDIANNPPLNNQSPLRKQSRDPTLNRTQDNGLQPSQGNQRSQGNQGSQGNVQMSSPLKRNNTMSASQERDKRVSSLALQQLQSQSTLGHIPESTHELTYFQNWDARFHQDGSMKARVMVISLHPAPSFKNLERQFSQHEGQLTWHYQPSEADLGTDLHLSLAFQERGGYSLTFLLNQQFVVLEGDQDVWDFVCPFRTHHQLIRIGGLICERTYHQEGRLEEGQTQELEAELFGKWGEKVPEARGNMRALLQKKREQERLKRSEGVEYREVSKYFSGSGEWVFSVLVEQKQNRFKCWMVQSLDPRHSQMSATIKSDVQNRENMYVEEMRRKKKLLHQAKPQPAP